jgi:hypothetical protein
VKNDVFYNVFHLFTLNWMARKMTENKFVKSAFQRAYSAWFSDYERSRRQSGRRRGAAVNDFPAPPTCPDDVVHYVNLIGRSRVEKVFGIHRTTLARWMAGTAVIPRPAWLLLVLMAEGRLPGMSEDWRQFRFDGDRLHIIGTRFSYSALEIAGWQYQQAHSAALARRVVDLERKTAYLLSVGRFGAANDALMAG